MPRGYFVAGTDTGVGKTRVSSALLLTLQAQGLTVAGMKPIASGCINTADGLRNDDAQRLIACSSVKADYSLVNPYAFEPAVAPHLAAQQTAEIMSLDKIIVAYEQLRRQVDCLVVEGVGGWQVPVNDDETMEDLAKRINLPVILVVGMRLGCINHALLTYQAIRSSGLVCCAWVANQVEAGMPLLEENIESVQRRLNIPCWGVIPWLTDINDQSVQENLIVPSI